MSMIGRRPLLFLLAIWIGGAFAEGDTWTQIADEMLEAGYADPGDWHLMLETGSPRQPSSSRSIAIFHDEVGNGPRCENVAGFLNDRGSLPALPAGYNIRYFCLPVEQE